MIPGFSTFNTAAGMFLSAFVILGISLSNTWNTGFLPINSNKVFDHFGKRYNITAVIDQRGMYDHKYMNYSAAYLASGNAIGKLLRIHKGHPRLQSLIFVVYGCLFGVYAAAVSHVILFHRYEVAMAFKSLWRTIRRQKKTEADLDHGYDDIHNLLMSKCPEGTLAMTLILSYYY